jgi:hypothetical protein
MDLALSFESTKENGKITIEKLRKTNTDII